MHDPFARGRRLVWRVVQAQGIVGTLLALVSFAAGLGLAPSLAAIWGAFSVALAQALAGWRQMRSVAAVETMLWRFYGAAAWKWMALFALFVLGLVGLELPAGGLLAGLIAAQIAGTWALLRYG